MLISIVNTVLIVLLTICLIVGFIMLKNTYNKNNKTEEKNLKKIIKKLVENDKFLKEKDLDNKNEIQELITQNSNDLGETKGYVTDNTALIDENKGLIDENKVLIDGNKVLIDSNIGLIGDLTNLQTEIGKKINQINEKKVLIDGNNAWARNHKTYKKIKQIKTFADVANKKRPKDNATCESVVRWYMSKRGGRLSREEAERVVTTTDIYSKDTCRLEPPQRKTFADVANKKRPKDNATCEDVVRWYMRRKGKSREEAERIVTTTSPSTKDTCRLD